MNNTQALSAFLTQRLTAIEELMLHQQNLEQHGHQVVFHIQVTTEHT
jgi:hypothetical protein